MLRVSRRGRCSMRSRSAVPLLTSSPVGEFLKFVVESYGLDRQRSTQRIEQLIETFEMGDYADELCETYSQGMKQRVVFSFASARFTVPGFWLWIEPLVGLDPRSSGSYRQGPVHFSGAIGLHGLDVDAPAGDRRSAGRPDRDCRPGPDAGRRNARGASDAASASRTA